MSDDKTLRGPRDANRISLEEDYEVRYWTDRFSISEARLRAVVEKVGVGVEAVARELSK